MNFLSDRKINRIATLPILLVGLLAYANTFQVPFVFDDIHAIVDNTDIHRLDGPQFHTPRYLAYLSFALNYRIGGYDLFGYHLVNLGIHLVTALLVYLLLRLTFRTPYFARSNVQESGVRLLDATARRAPAAWVMIPLFVALLFAVHPVQTQAVTYIVQRMTSMTAMFYLASLVLYVAARLTMQTKKDESSATASGGRALLLPLLLLGGATVAAVLAMKTKEIAFTLPLAAVLYEVCFFSGSWKKRILCLLPLLATLPIVPLSVIAAGRLAVGHEGSVFADGGGDVFAAGDLPRTVYLFTQLRVIVTYLRLLVFPVNQNLDYDYPVYASFFAPPVLGSLLFLLALVLLAVYLFARTRIASSTAQHSTAQHSTAPWDPLPRLVAFGIFWFFLTLAVESSLVPIKDVIVEHRLYLPSVGFLIAAVAVVMLFVQRINSAVVAKGCVIALAAATAVLGYATFQRNHVWGDDVRLWQDVAAKSPAKARPWNNLGVLLNDRGRYPEAVEVLTRSIALDPEHPHAYNNLALALIMTGRSREAIPLLKKAIGLHIRYDDAYINLAAAFNQIRQFDQAVNLLEQNMGWLDARVEAHYHLGVAYAFLGNRVAARQKMAIVEQGGAQHLREDLRRLLNTGGE